MSINDGLPLSVAAIPSLVVLCENRSNEDLFLNKKMKKIVAVFGALVLFAGFRAKAQKSQQPVKKETTKPTNGSAAKADAVDNYLIIKGNAASQKNANPAFIKGSHPTLKGASSSANGQMAPRQTIPPASTQPSTPHKASNH